MYVLPLLAAALAQEPDLPPEAASPPPPEGVPSEPLPLLEAPSLADFVEAPYPEAARAAGLEGSVLLGIEIDASGAVTRVDVLRPAGHGFDEVAAEAARQMRFTPARDATGPVPVVIEFEYGFSLAETPTDLSSSPDAPPPPIVLDGELREMGTRRPLARFPVRVEPSGQETLTDENGRFAFRGLPPGPYTLRAAQPGWDPVAQPVEVTDGDLTTARLWIRSRSYGDEGILGLYAVETVDVSKRTITMEEVRRVPGTFGDPIRVIQTMPGAARAPFGSGLLVIRGSNPEDSGVYVDGIRIPYIYHLGGFASVINPDLVAAVDYLPGGFGPRYGRSTGGVVDVTTRTEFPERTKVAASMDLLDAGAVVSGTLGQDGEHGFGFAARRSYVDAILPLFLADDGFTVKPRWYDYQAKWQWRGSGGRSASVLAFGFEDVLTAQSPPGFSQGTDADAQGELGTAYSTHRVIARWRQPLGESWSFELTPSFGRDYASFVLGNDWRIDQTQWIAEIRAEAPWRPSEHFGLVSGVDFVGGWADFRIELPFDPSAFAEIDPLAEREPFALADTQQGWGPDTYVLAEWRPLEDADALLVAPGLRLDYVNFPGQLAFFALDPRFSTKWRATGSTLLKGSVGLYHQPPQPFQSYRADDRPVGVGPERALAAAIGVEQKVTGALRVDVEGFYKALDQLIVGNRAFSSLDDPFFTNEGAGRAYGVELMVRQERVRNLFGWLSYTLSRSERRDYPESDWYAFDFDQTHIFVATAGYVLPYDFELGAKAEYVTGNPTTPYALGLYDVDQDSYQGFATGAYNSERLPDYAALSLRVDKLFTFKAWQLAVYCDFLNVVRGVNPEFELYNYDYTERTYVRGLPFLPSPGFEARFEL
jgi:TonB family protein